MKFHPILILVLLLNSTLGAFAADSPIWIEAETGKESNITRNAWFDAINTKELSGEKWISSYADAGLPFGRVTCSVDTPQTGAYQFWVRCCTGGGLSYQVDQNPPVDLDLKSIRLEDKANSKKSGSQPRILQVDNIAVDAKFDARFVGWINLGSVSLSSGKHDFTFVLGKEGGARFGAVDCFVLSIAPFTPNGKYKPGDKAPPMSELNASHSWAFTPSRDNFSTEAAFDLRSLNEKFAGEHGFIKLSPDKSSFVRGDGVPIKFWGGTDSAMKKNDMKEMEHQARFLAKRGVNIVRWHDMLPVQKEGSKITDVDQAKLDEAFKLVAAMKKEGVYSILSCYWGSHTDYIKSWGIPDPGNKNCSALVFFDPATKEGFKARLKTLYTTPNPYTGIPLAKDPAVAIIQLQNEDSMLFWTMGAVKGQQLKNLRKLFADFLIKKYGSLEKTKEAWKNYTFPNDDWSNDLPPVSPLWELTDAARKQAPEKGKDQPGREERLADYFEFMVRTMYDFNSEMVKYLREELGCTQLINAGNWKTVDPVLCDEGERWSYTACDVIAKNHYFGSLHSGANRGYQILPGHTYTDMSGAQEPEKLPFNVKQVVGHPFTITESLWVPPNDLQSEGPLMVAAQTCLNGMGPFFWFSDNAPEWADMMGKWTWATPVLLGQFPAAALIYRLNYVKQGAVVVHEERSTEDTWRRTTPLLSEGMAFDPNRDAGDGEDNPESPTAKSKVDPFAFLIGRVEVAYNGDPAKTQVMDLTPYIDRSKGTIRSTTGETAFDLKPGVYRVNSPKAQGAAGFLKASGPQNLTDVDIDCGNKYATIVVVPLDDKPICESSRLLVQAGTVNRMTDWSASPLQILSGGKQLDGFRIVNVGKAPWRVENTEATITVRNKSLTRATALDPNGMPMQSSLKTENVQGALRVTLPPNALYVLLTN